MSETCGARAEASRPLKNRGPLGHTSPSRGQELVSMGVDDPRPRGHLLAGHENLWAWAKLLAEADD